jgi:predicted GIY-YIG superfamily endonuclease
MNRTKLPNSPCTYCLIVDGEVIYIGSTRRLKSRFYEHKIRYGFARNIILPWLTVPDTSKVVLKIKKTIKYGDWVMDEMRLIKKLQPKYNLMHKSNGVNS